MFVKLSCKIADRLEHCGIISKSNRTLYEYGLRQMFATILNILTMLLIGFIMGLAVPAMVYTIAYIPLRVYAGGYHASTPQRCWAFSAIMLWIALCIVKYQPKCSQLAQSKLLLNTVYQFHDKPVFSKYIQKSILLKK